MIYDVLPPKKTRSRINVPSRQKSHRKLPNDGRGLYNVLLSEKSEEVLKYEYVALEMESLVSIWLEHPKFDNLSPERIALNEKPSSIKLKHKPKKLLIKRTACLILVVAMLSVTGYISYSAWSNDNYIRSQIQLSDK
jgi:hypothetical protein